MFDEFTPTIPDVLLQATVVFIACLLVTRWFIRLSWVWSLFIPVLKTLLFSSYFIFFYDGKWTFQDDYQYLFHAKAAFENEYNPLTLISVGGLEFLTGISSGQHILYPYWTILSCWVFGLSYSSPVAMNIILTFIGAGLVKRLAHEFSKNTRYSSGLAVFWLFHPELLSWSTVSNCKDVLVVVLLLQMALGLAILSGKGGRKRQGFVVTSTAVFLLLFLRYYLPVIGLAAFALAKMGFSLSPKKVFLAVTGVVTAVFIAPSGVVGHLMQEWQPGGMVYRLVHFILQPLPWNIESEYSFLTFSAIFHWVALPFSLTGLYGMRRSQIGKYLLIFGAFIILVAAAVPILETVRHRLQINILFVWGIWHFIWVRIPALQTNSTKHTEPRLNCV